MKLKDYCAIFLAILGVQAFSKNESEVFGLTDEQKEALKAEGYSESFIAKFNTALENNFEEGTGTATAEAVTPVDMHTLRQTALALSKAQEELEALNADKTALASEKNALQAKVAGLQGDVERLSNEKETDPGAGSQHASTVNTEFNAMDDRQLGGLQGEHYSLNRPYNQRARAALLAKQGLQIAVPMASSTDFAQLQADLGDFYRQGQDKAIASMVAALKSVSDIFPTEYGIIDREVITNLFMGEFSQSDNSGSDFSKVVKGKYEIQPEEVRMYDVMLAHEFKDLKKLEKSWIAKIVGDGSSSIKMSFIQYLLLETAKVLVNEKNRRAVQGRRKEPTVDVPGLAMEASNGVYAYIDEKILNNQIKTFELGEVTAANIGEKVKLGTSMIPQELIDTGMIALYMPTNMITEYHEYNETHYGLNQDYKPDMMVVKQYPQVKIIPVPNPGSHRRLIWTFEGNLKTLENVAGEMLNFRVIVKEWSVSVISQWKEGFGAPLVGKKWARKQDMDYLHQFVFCSDKDLSSSTFMNMEQDTTTPSALFHSSLVSVPNTALKTITDIKDVAVGQTVKLKCGSDAYGIKIANTGNFSLLASAWEPGIGDVITMVKRADGKFIELSRAAVETSLLAIAADDTTPSVADGTEFVTNANTQATAITTFDDAVTGKTYVINGAGTTNASTIANSGNFTLTGSMTLSVGKQITLLALGGGKFAEISRV
ncbi:MAG TPA: hypothetical protein VK152_00285 [Paludibacter sp.]|nr:hypothetical protein [Paludibacter sp.]